MKTIKRISGILILALAFLFLLQIPKHLSSGDDKATSKIVIDVAIAAALGVGASALLKNPAKPS
jgi:hypothetical protein